MQPGKPLKGVGQLVGGNPDVVSQTTIRSAGTSGRGFARLTSVRVRMRSCTLRQAVKIETASASAKATNTTPVAAPTASRTGSPASSSGCSTTRCQPVGSFLRQVASTGLSRVPFIRTAPGDGYPFQRNSRASVFPLSFEFSVIDARVDARRRAF